MDGSKRGRNEERERKKETKEKINGWWIEVWQIKN